MADPVNTAPPAPDPPSQAVTPAWKDKSLYVAVLGFLLPVLDRKFGWNLTADELIAALAPLVAFILGHKWKSGAITVAEIKARNTVTLPDNLTSAQAAGLLDQLGQVAATAGKAIAVVLALTLAFGPSRAYAQDVPDAPYAIKQGEGAPSDGVFLTTARAAATFKECAEAKANAEQLAAALNQAPGSPVMVVVLGSSLGVLTGVLVTFLVMRK